MAILRNTVIFDLDGVLTDTAKYHYLAWKKIAVQERIYFDSDINERLKGIDRMSSLEIILEKATRQYTMDEKMELAKVKNELYIESIQTMSADDLLPGALKTLETAKGKGLKIGLASASKNAFAVIERLGIRDYFDYVADASQIKKGKPDPEVFLNVAASLGVEPKLCIGVEDASAGVKAIKAAGMFAVGVGDPQILIEADRVIRSLDEFEIENYLI